MPESPIRVGTASDAPDEPSKPLSADEVFADPTREELTAGDMSPLEDLAAALAAPAERKPVTLRVPTRPGVKIRCHGDFDHEQRKAWQARSETKKSRRRMPGQERDVDEMKFACLVIANTCEAVLFNGKEATDTEGTPLTFRHKQLWDMVDAYEPETAIRKLFANDAHVLIASGEILLNAGLDDDLTDETDPTVRAD